MFEDRIGVDRIFVGVVRSSFVRESPRLLLDTVSLLRSVLEYVILSVPLCLN